jgi:hypothetical protein
MNTYEQKQLKNLRKWQAQKPDWGTRLLAGPTSVAGQAVQRLVPVSAIQAALTGINNVALKLSSEQSLAKAAGVSDIEQLRKKPLEVCDRLALREQRRAMAMGGAGGAVFGVVGFAGLAADIPTLLTLVMRTIHRTGLCYGEAVERELIIGVFALASANSAAEKAAALAALESDMGDMNHAAVRDGLERAAERELAKEAAVFSLQTLAQRIGVNLGKRKLAGGVPILGAVVGSAVNAWYVRDIAHIAQHVFQERWLRRKYPDLHF